MSSEILQFKQEREKLVSQFKNLDEKKVKIGENKMSAPLKFEKLMTFSRIFDEERLSEPKEESKPVQSTQAIGEVLNLNEKMILTLERADQQIQALSQLNNKLVSDVQMKEQELNAYKQAEVQAKQAQYNNMLNEVHSKWCETFSLKDMSQQEEARKMLSAFESIEKLESIKGFLNNKMIQMSDVPQQITRQSEELVQPQPVVKTVKPWDLATMSAEEKRAYTDQIYEKLLRTTKK